MSLFIAVLWLCLLTCCGTTGSGGFGLDQSPAPGWERVRGAAVNALTAPETWLPAVGALAFQIDDADRKVSDWAVRRMPVYGSQQSASKISDYLLTGSGALWVMTGMAAPAGYGLADWTFNKARIFSIEMGAGIITRGVVGDIKDGSGRTRPSGVDQSSFPSGHASGASFYMTVASRHVGSYGWSPAATTAARFSLGTIAAATAWARVEAQFHYPSDVLAGLAIGHFFGAFLSEAFLGPADSRNASLLLEPSRDGAMALVRFNF